MTTQSEPNPRTRIEQIVALIQGATIYGRREPFDPATDYGFTVRPRGIDTGIEVFYHGLRWAHHRNQEQNFVRQVGMVLFRAYPGDNQVQQVTRNNVQGFIVYPS